MNILLVVTLCGPIYINIAGTSKDVILSFLGVAIFQDQELSLKFFVGLALSFLGVSYFTYAKMINIQYHQLKMEQEKMREALKLAMESERKNN